MYASENGLKVSVEDAKCVLANAFIQAALFQQFVLREEQITFKINLTVLMVKCSSHSLILKYSAHKFCTAFLSYTLLCIKNRAVILGTPEVVFIHVFCGFYSSCCFSAPVVSEQLQFAPSICEAQS